jgi:Ca-activated chloride channel homolog
MRILVSILFFALVNSSKAQIVFEKTKHDFGDLSSTSDRFVDIVATNKGVKKEYLLSVKKPTGVVYLVNGQFLEQDGVLTVRLQVNPKNKGKFTYEVEIYTSDKDTPTVIKLSGNVSSVSTSQNSFQACPDFSSRPQSNATDFDLTVVTVDKWPANRKLQNRQARRSTSKNSPWIHVFLCQS